MKVTCDVCGKVGARRVGLVCPKGWFYAEFTIHDLDDVDQSTEVIVWSCSLACNAGAWKAGDVDDKFVTTDSLDSTLPPAVESRIDQVIVSRLAERYDPFIRLGITREGFEQGMPWHQEPLFIPDAYRPDDQTFHYDRIQYFVDLLAVDGALDPISVDNVWSSMAPYGIVVTDGHHRLCAAIIYGSLAIPASISGTRPIIEWLTGEREDRPL